MVEIDFISGGEVIKDILYFIEDVLDLVSIFVVDVLEFV